MCPPAIALGIAAVATSALGVGASVIMGDAQLRNAKKAQAQQQRDAERAAAAQERAMNAANQKRPDIGAIYAEAARRGGGPAGTLLTGPGGARPDPSALSRTSLLGGAG